MSFRSLPARNCCSMCLLVCIIALRLSDIEYIISRCLAGCGVYSSVFRCSAAFPTPSCSSLSVVTSSGVIGVLRPTTCAAWCVSLLSPYKLVCWYSFERMFCASSLLFLAISWMAVCAYSSAINSLLTISWSLIERSFMLSCKCLRIPSIFSRASFAYTWATRCVSGLFFTCSCAYSSCSRAMRS